MRNPFSKLMVSALSMAAIAVAGAAFAPDASAQVTVTVVDDSGLPVQNGFRWLVEEDNTYGSVPGMPTPNAPLGVIPGDPSYTLGVNIHRSHAPTVCAGDTAPANETTVYPTAAVVLAGPAAATVTITGANCPGYTPLRKYIVSVLPWHTSTVGTPPFAQTGYTMSGRNVAVGQSSVNVVVHAYPMPTAQITILVFKDDRPINAAYDQPDESGLPGFSLLLTDPIDKVLQDAFGNPVGTTYQFLHTTADGRPADAAGNPLPQGSQPQFKIDPTTGLPLVAWRGDGYLYTCPGTTKPLASYTPYEKANCIDPWTLTPMDAGEAVVRYLAPDKYTVEPVPPGNDPSWILTGTLEGTRGNDAWVRGGEPRFNINLGQLNWLVFFGFVKPMNNLASIPNPTGAALGAISGQVVYAHDMHPPLSPGLSPGLPVPNAYVGVNNLNGNDEQIYTAPCDPATGAFTINGVRPGTYQLAFWDKAVNAIIDYRTVTVGPGQTVALGPVSVYGWFGTYTGSVFSDVNGNGLRDATETGIPGMLVNVHFSDGSLYGSATTDASGNFSFSQYFAWWRFLVADVDIGRFKPTGMSAYVDNGGPLPATALGRQGINPQIQPDGLDHRTQLGLDSISQAMQLFQDMTNRIDWGKAPWGPGENGGVHGIINYAITRTEEDPTNSAIDPWEPAVPRVTVRLHQGRQYCADASGLPLPQESSCSSCTAAGVALGATAVNDCWIVADSGAFPLSTTSDSWDDNQPTGCVGAADPSQGPMLWSIPELVNGFAIPACAETFHNWDQIRPGVFDGAYWFQAMPNGTPIPPGYYIVEVVAPPGYEVLRWGDRDIEFGDPKIPFLVEPPPCVGPTYSVPPFHTLYPDQQVPTNIPGGWDASGNWTSPVAPSCSQKLIALNPGANPEVDFNIFTWVPKAARIWGTVWNDLMLEFNPNSPNASGNFGVPWLPVAIKDYAGNEIARFYTDQWGHFDGLVAANYDIAPPIPLGLVLGMYTIAPNDPGPILDTNPASLTYGQYITDPWFDPEYSQEVIRENWEFYSGRTTFIDTIVLPVGAFVGNRVPLNCDYTDRTPEIRQVSPDVILPAGGGTLTITSVGSVTAPNPNYDPTDINSPATLTWDHGFGSSGTVTVGGLTLPSGNVTWAADGGSIQAVIPPGVDGQLVITRGDSGLSTTVGVTLYSNPGVPVVYVNPPPSSCQGLSCAAIQPAIDAAPPGAIIVLNPGRYQDYVNLWKPVTLQGKGAAVTILDGTAALGNFALKQQAFAQLQTLIGSGAIGVVPNQASNFTLEQGAGILVAGCGNTPSCGPTGTNSSFFAPGASARIDGLTITGATEAGGGILVNGFVANLSITNDEVFANQGSIGGGIRVGENALIGAGNPTGSSFNRNLVIDHNRISQNGSLFSGGGGIAMYAGADGYRISNNYICGNFSAQYGGGIGHFGLSDHGVIANNKIVSNESFDEGGGIHVGGENAAGTTALTQGAGSVLISANLIQGNKGGDDGGGLRTRRFNGTDVASNPSDPSKWYSLDVFNNLVVNNSSADAGGGMAFDDTIKARVIGNTVAYNDSTATSSDSFGGVCTENSPAGQTCPAPEAIGGLVTSIPAVAGIASIAHTTPLQAALATPGGYCAANPGDAICATFSNPVLVDDIVWRNRSFYWDATANSNLGGLLPKPGTPYWDLAVYQSPGMLTVTDSLLTDGVGAGPGSASDVIGQDPGFVSWYLNVYQATAKGAALGNFVVATFGPNGMQGDYHLASASSPAAAAGGPIPPAPTTDYDGQTRLAPADIGADQVRTP